MNRLSAETSPYLLQHASNPVSWHAWGEEALTLARTEDKPILLSIGYSACHWCHVMAHECFEQAEVAEVMNALFINIKVDREERPDLDQIYQTAQQTLSGRPGGWPLTMFLTPDGAPFFGGTYFPRQARHGLPGFPDLCQRIGELWTNRRDDIENQKQQIVAALATHAVPPGAPPHAIVLDAAPLAAARKLLLGSFDHHYGGFGGAPKFPHVTELALLLRQDDPLARQPALLTLTAMAEGGIYDQLGGGFCRYSVDARWEIPHFEKMLYDNGPLLGLYADAWRLTGDPLFARTVEQTVGWVLREMQAPDGGFYSSLDADSEGEEGKYYVWDRAEIVALLSSQESALATRHWGLDEPPNFENRHWHLRVAEALDEAEQALLDQARARLWAARQQRIRPACDDKILTAWNGLMIEGLARAARLFERPDWLAAARRALDFLQRSHWRAGRLLATSRAGRAHLPAYLDDYAFLLAALLEVMQTEFRSADLALARQLADALLEHFEDRPAGGFYFTAHDHEALLHRPKTAFDTAMAAGNGVAATALQRLGHLLGEVRYLEAARRTLECFWSQLRQQPAGFSSLLTALAEALTPPTLIMLRGPAPEVADWARRLAAERHYPEALIVPLANGSGPLPEGLARPEPPRVHAWVCQEVTCLPPTDDFDTLLALLSTAAPASA